MTMKKLKFFLLTTVFDKNCVTRTCQTFKRNFYFHKTFLIENLSGNIEILKIKNNFLLFI